MCDTLGTHCEQHSLDASATRARALTVCHHAFSASIHERSLRVLLLRYHCAQPAHDARMDPKLVLKR